MPRFLTLLTLFPVGVAAFTVRPQISSPFVVLKASNKYDEKGHHITMNPMEGYKGVDVERARDCAEHFGKCSAQEIEDLKSSK
jgi:hypothetical protein